jgi:hypothetical protein
VLVLNNVEGADAVAAFARHLRDERAGFSFAENEDEHGSQLLAAS